MTPDQLVARVAAAFDIDARPDDRSVVATLVEAGATAREAKLALSLVQIACGRILLDGLGITFSDEYACVDAAGKVVERGTLSKHAVFATALTQMKSAPRALKHLAVTSADVQAVNQALNAGSDPKNLVTGASSLFVD